MPPCALRLNTKCYSGEVWAIPKSLGEEEGRYSPFTSRSAKPLSKRLPQPRLGHFIAQLADDRMFFLASLLPRAPMLFFNNKTVFNRSQILT